MHPLAPLAFCTNLFFSSGGFSDCDHWHDGAGFVTSHVAISLMFEQSLQAVNPSISLPYWDFTMEGTAHDWSDFRDTEVFSDDWFGDAAPRNVRLSAGTIQIRQCENRVDRARNVELCNIAYVPTTSQHPPSPSNLSMAPTPEDQY